MGNNFCKIQDPKDNNIYILTDKNKQPLFCSLTAEYKDKTLVGDEIQNVYKNNSKCMIYNYNKILEKPEQYDLNNISNKDIIEYTNIPCVQQPPYFKQPNNEYMPAASEILKNINIGDYKMANINKDAIISDISNSVIPDKDPETMKRMKEAKDAFLNILRDPSKKFIDNFEWYYNSYINNMDSILKSSDSKEEKITKLTNNNKQSNNYFLINEEKNTIFNTNTNDNNVITFIKNNFFLIIIVFFVILFVIGIIIIKKK